MPRYDFSGRVALVTGGCNGIGRAIAERLQSDGADVWILDHTADPLQARQLKADITDGSSIAKAAETLAAKVGALDMLVHSAGIAGPTQPLTEFDPDVWRRVIDVNLVGTYEICRHFVPLLQERQRSWLVNIASLAGKEGTPNASAYSAAKAGVIALTKSLAKEYAKSGLRINALAPAAIETELLAQMSAEHVATMIAKSPQGRLGLPEEVAEIVAWMVSDACSFNTGAIFDLSGGRAVL
jgi:3-oxoacyl-[acyl-carrier protein] reductase